MVYTSSFRTERYIKHLFRLYGVRFDGIVNGMRHLKEVQRNSKSVLPQKLPNRYRISLIKSVCARAYLRCSTF